MGMLDRYKKGGGIVELVKLIEESGESKKIQLLNMIRAEDPAFAAQVEGRLFSYEGISKLPENLVAEIIAATPPKLVALALHGEDPNFVTLCEKCLGKNFNDYKQEKEAMASTPPTPPQIEAARRKLVATARKLESEGQIKLPGSDVTGGASGGASGAASQKIGDGPAETGSASADSGCPPLESFQLEPPPEGLMGERFEQYLKTQLGF